MKLLLALPRVRIQFDVSGFSDNDGNLVMAILTFNFCACKLV